MSGLINRVRELHDFGQKAWLEVSGGKLLAPGKLGRLIDYDGITGICSDPASLPQTLADNEHDDAIVRGLAAPGAPAEQISESVNLQDTRRSADRLLRTFRNADGYDGFVSLEVSPIFAFDAAGMVAEARRLLGALDRANILIQVPATREGLSAIRQLTSEGVCVSATMVFGVTRYREVVDAFIRGLEDRRSKGHLLNRIVSVAGVSVNRIDTMVDEKLRSLPKRFSAQAGNALLGKAGVQVARFAYQVYKQTVASPRWASLAAQGARPQRLLWTGTDATNLADGDVRYVEQLVGRDSITALSLPTLVAYRDHGNPTPTLESNLYEIATFPGELLKLGIDMEDISRQLEADCLRQWTARVKASWVVSAREPATLQH